MEESNVIVELKFSLLISMDEEEITYNKAKIRVTIE